MWICQRCYTENRETSNACEGCGAPRAAGRFNTAAPQQRPARAQAPIMSYPSAPNEAAPQRPARSEYQAPPPEISCPNRKKQPFLPRLGRGIGALLALLLPILTALLAWRQYGVLSQALTPLLLGDGAADWMRIALYAVLALLAVLLSSLPGLWTLFFARGREDRP